LPEKFLIIKIIERDGIRNLYIVLHVKYSLFLSDFNYTGIFLTDFGKIFKY